MRDRALCFSFFGLVGHGWFSRVYLRAEQSSNHTEMDIHPSLRSQRGTHYNSFITCGMPPTLLTHYSTSICIYDPPQQ